MIWSSGRHITPEMAWLNYQHLLYFWTAAREGALVPTAKGLLPVRVTAYPLLDSMMFTRT